MTGDTGMGILRILHILHILHTLHILYTLNMPIGGKFAGDLVAGFSAFEPIIKKV